ncbi:MAG: helix-turn-helix domain-containing protein [Gulosibacter sp.]|uniref:helix-turn-helix domain-containing protein n=1 Tax=Gulosibacter sp. TaxID=2817531 RepID=UPI003F8F3DD6
MRSTMDGDRGRTYVPQAEEAQQLGNIITEMERQVPHGGTMRIISADHQEIELPNSLFTVIRQVAQTLAEGRGVTVIPHDAQLTTQEAADFLGVSRPTLVKLLREDRVPHTTVGRHRRVLLADIIAYQERERAERQALLRRTVREGQQDGLFDVVYEPDDE